MKNEINTCRQRNIFQQGKDSTGVGERGGPLASDIDAEGRRPAAGVPSTARDTPKDGASSQIRQERPVRLPDLLPEQPRHHHSRLGAHRAAQTCR